MCSCLGVILSQQPLGTLIRQYMQVFTEACICAQKYCKNQNRTPDWLFPVAALMPTRKHLKKCHLNHHAIKSYFYHPSHITDKTFGNKLDIMSFLIFWNVFFSLVIFCIALSHLSRPVRTDQSEWTGCLSRWGGALKRRALKWRMNRGAAVMDGMTKVNVF